MTLRLTSQWEDYELLDSGGGRKLERFGQVTLIRPEAKAPWHPALPGSVWGSAQAVFHLDAETATSHWEVRHPMEQRWSLSYRGLRFWAELGQSRQVGVFPENATHWDWIDGQIRRAGAPVHALNLFAYTGLATLAAARAGARVTHVDASRRAVAWARDNQTLSGLSDRPVRWIVDDALTYLRREQRRGVRYQGIILDPPAFGRGPGGEVWTFDKLFSALGETCRAVLSPSPLFVVATVYARGASMALLQAVMADMLDGCQGTLTVGELVTVERSAGRVITNAKFARWKAD